MLRACGSCGSYREARAAHEDGGAREEGGARATRADREAREDGGACEDGGAQRAECYMVANNISSTNITNTTSLNNIC